LQNYLAAEGSGKPPVNWQDGSDSCVSYNDPAADCHLPLPPKCSPSVLAEGRRPLGIVLATAALLPSDCVQKARVQVWLFEQVAMRLEGRIIVRVRGRTRSHA